MKIKQLFLAIAVVANMHAAVITYNPTEGTGSDTANVQVTFDDNTAGFITGTVSVLPDASDPDTGDIRAVYFNLVDLPGSLTDAQVLAAITGADITATTLGAQLTGDASLNPLGPFSVGLEIGSSGMGKDDIPFTTFQINLAALDPDITLANFGAVGVRLTSVGTGSNRGGSGKFIDTTPEEGGGGGSEIPEPGTYALAASAFAAMFTYRKLGRK